MISKFGYLFLFLISLSSCKEHKKETELLPDSLKNNIEISYAKGFTITKTDQITEIYVTTPWPNAEKGFRYALIPREKLASTSYPKNYYDAVIATPVKSIVATSTTHIPALEALGVEKTLVGFPSTDFISSMKTRVLITEGKVQDLGKNDDINVELTLSLNPELVMTFGVDNTVSSLDPIEAANIPIVYNGDWTEESPLGKAEWIKFIAPFFEKEDKADEIFKTIETNYLDAKKLVQNTENKPTVMTGSLYKDVWYVSGGKSWAAQFLKDAQTNYLWRNNNNTGSTSLSLETALEKFSDAEYWISPGLFTTYAQIKKNNEHNLEFSAFKNKKIFGYAATTGTTGGMLYFEVAPHRPDLVLKDLISIFHPEVLPNYKPFFFKPLK